MLQVSVVRKRPGFSLEATFAAPTPGVIALFGRSGSGKTTLVNIISGLSAPDAGDIRLDEDVLTDIPVERRRIGYVFQDARLFPHLNVTGNLRYGEKRARAAPQVIGFDEVVTLLGLTQFLQRRPRELSGGERQRVALGRALLSQPRLLLLDEPLAGLSLEERVAVKALIAGIPRDVTVVMIEHDMDTALDLAERITVLHYGSVIVEGTRGEVVADPKTREVYLGSQGAN